MSGPNFCGPCGTYHPRDYQDCRAPKAVRQVLALSDERDQWLQFALDMSRDAYAAGLADGRQQQAAEADRAWAAVPVQRAPVGPTLAELELLRWGPGGRESHILPDSPNAGAE